MIRRAALLIALSTVACAGDDATDPPETNAPCGRPARKGSPLGEHCGQLIDEAGRVVLLRGVNARVEGLFDVSFDDGRKALEEIPSYSAEDAQAMRDWGFDSLRLPINWSGIEPTKDGGFDSNYLDRVEQVLDLSHAAGLRVLLDLHQDAYSKEIGEDGAPLWAIVPPPTKLLEGPLTDLEDRRLSKQVLDAFDTFFGEGADGTFLRERFTQMAVHVMQRFGDHPAVIGLEIFNEPIATIEGIDRLNAAAYAAIRAAAPKKLYLFEPSSTRNVLDTAPLPEAPLGPMSGYAPHVYTLAFVSTDAQKQAMTKATLRTSNENARLEADAWQAPLVITEWGFDPNAIKASEYFTWQSELQEEHAASAFFWVWKERSQGNWGCFDFDPATQEFSERTALKQTLARVRPMAVAGWPTRIDFDRKSGVFELELDGNPSVREPHRIAVAPALGAPSAVECDDQVAPHQSAEHGEITVHCGHGSRGHHLLRVRVPPAP